jgi:hypothetical protein
MKEDLLQTIWKLKRFDLHNLTCTSGEKLQIINFGNHNFNAGPDFLDANVIIGDKQWFGSVEIHIKSSDWNLHNHQLDPAYNNVILHVVYLHNKEIKNQNNQTIPTLELNNRIELDIIENFENLFSNSSLIPCSQSIATVDQSKIKIFLSRLLVERLESKAQKIIELLEASKNDWEHVCYKLILKYMGLKVNAEAFDTLSNYLPYKMISRVSSNLFQTEALILGHAGLLETCYDVYSEKLAKEYNFLKSKFKLNPMTGVQWNFGKLRPSNFPSLRMAQIASIYHHTPKLFRSIISNPDRTHLDQILSHQASSYWDTHFIPGKLSKNRFKNIGHQTRMLLIINAFIPLIFTYAYVTSNELLKEKALDLYFKIPAERNKIISQWKKHGLIYHSASETQALIELKTQYCDNFQCLRCQIGRNILFK